MDCTAEGCNYFSCGSIGHHKDCVNYPESMQEMIDVKNESIKELEKALDRITDVAADCDCWECFPQSELDFAVSVLGSAG